jgi:intracellular septation protein
MSASAATALWLTPLLLAWLWRPRQATSPTAWALLAAFGALGACTLWFGLYGQGGAPAAFAHWKPTVVYWTLAAILFAAPLLGWDYPAKIVIGTYFALSNREWRWINAGIGAMYAVMGGVNLWVAADASDKDWVGFKYACMMNLLIIVLFRLNFVWLPLLIEDVSVKLYRRAAAACRRLSRLF